MRERLTPTALLSAFLLMGLWTLGPLCLSPASAAAPEWAWTDMHDGGSSANDDGYCLLIAPDDHLIVGGESTDLDDGSDLFIRKLDRLDGSEMWSVRYEGYDNKEVAISEMTWDSVGQLLVAGFIRGCVG